jgi:hypothetical protein
MTPQPITIEITGYSDDIVSVSGGINEEFSCMIDNDEKAVIAVSDGTLLAVKYDDNGIWRFTPITFGAAKYDKVDGIVADDTNDVVKLSGDIRWVAFGSGQYVYAIPEKPHA